MDPVTLLDRLAAGSGDRPFLVASRTLSYAESRSHVRRLARLYRQYGVERGDRLLILTRNRPATVLAVLAAMDAGIVYAVLEPGLTPASVAAIARQVRPALALLDESTRRVAGALGSVPVVWMEDVEDVADAAPAAAEYETGRLPSVADDGYRPAGIIYTSGSSGAPCGVVISRENIAFTVTAIQERLRYQASDRIGLFVPLAFDYGLYQVFLALHAGASLYVGDYEQVDPRFLNTLDAHDVTVLPAVPTLVRAMIRLSARQPIALRRLRCLTSTGDVLSPATVREFHRSFPHVQVYSMYGLTECKRVSILLPHEWPDRPDSVGRPLDGTGVRVVDDDGRDVNAGEVGELVVAGPHVALGYWDAPDESARRFRRCADGSRVLHTGDLASIDAEGFLYVHGRKDALIKHRGFRISASEIERAACSISGISDAVVVKGVDDDALCLLAAVQVPDLTADGIIRELALRLEAYKVPTVVRVVAELPRSSRGKVSRRALAALLAETAS